MERSVLVVGVAVVVVSAGCSSLPGDRPTFGAAEATVSETALSETRYESVTVTRQSTVGNLSAGSETRLVEVDDETVTPLSDVSPAAVVESAEVGLLGTVDRRRGRHA
jgi:hypothetical protein